MRGISRSSGRPFALNFPACRRKAGLPTPGATVSAARTGAARSARKMRSSWKQRARCLPATASPSPPSIRRAQSIRRAGRSSSGTIFWITGIGFWPRSASRLCPRFISGPGARSAAIRKAARSFRCSTRRKMFRPRSRPISTTGASPAISGAHSRRRHCRSRCAGCWCSTTRTAS